jgi:hypothetical protein
MKTCSSSNDLQKSRPVHLPAHPSSTLKSTKAAKKQSSSGSTMTMTTTTFDAELRAALRQQRRQ